jgi:hypothetical protein
VTAVPVDRIKCPTRKGVTHAPVTLLGLCASGQHGRCPGHVTNGCGCVTYCRCTVPQVHGYNPHPYEEDPVPLPSPFTVPDPKAAEHPEAVVTPQPSGWAAPTSTLHTTVTDWTDRIEPRARPWVDGTGEPGTLEVMVRCFAMAAGDLHKSDDPWEDYDETALLAMLGILRASVRRAALLDDLLVAHLHKHHPWGKRIVDGIGEVNTRRREAKVHWDTYGTAEAVVEAVMAEREGTLPDDPMEPVRWVLEAAAIDYYRKGALRDLGLDPGDYFTKEKGTLAVDVPVPD